MALNFKKIGVDAGVFTCELATIPTAPPEIIAEMMGDVVTVNKVGITKSNKGCYALFSCDEYPDYAFHAGALFNDLVAAWQMAADPDHPEFAPGDCDKLNAEIASVGGIKMRFTKKDNKSDSSKSPYWVPTFV